MIFPDGQVFEEIWQNGILTSHKKLEDSADPERMPTNSEILNASLNRSKNAGSKRREGPSEGQDVLLARNRSKGGTYNVKKETDVQKEIVKMLENNSDVLQWTVNDVLLWLNHCKLEHLSNSFQKLQIDGYTLVQLKEQELETHLKIESFGHRKNLMRYICLLKSIWISQTAAYGLNHSENLPSFLEEDFAIFGNQSSIVNVRDLPHPDNSY